MSAQEFVPPRPDAPMLIGLLIDVSGSMTSSIGSQTNREINRLQSFEQALGEFASKAGELSREHGRGLAYVFAYGFGFGGIFSLFSGGSGPAVRDLLEKPGEKESTIPLEYLGDHWRSYQAHVKGLAMQMFGNTPMGEGLKTVRARFSQESMKGKRLSSRILFLLSDGEPTDSSFSEVVEYAETLKSDGVIVVSCYVTDSNITEPRHVYGQAHDDWPEGAKLMFECASELPLETPFEAYMREHRWEIDKKGRLFTQINQSEILSEFLNVVISPLDRSNKESGALTAANDGRLPPGRRELTEHLASQEAITDEPETTSTSAQELRGESRVRRPSPQQQSDEMGKLLFLITNWTFASGIVLFFVGVVLVLVGGAHADSTLELFGQNIKTTSVGLATACVGVIMIVTNIRRILKSFDLGRIRGNG